MNRTSTLTIACLLGTVLLAGNARADELTKSNWPLSAVERPILIPKGMLELRGDTARFNLSADEVGDPIQIAPDLYYGFGKTLNVGIVHWDNGICVSGDSCDKAYNDIGIDALLGFMNEGTLLLAFRMGVRIPDFEDLVGGLQTGLAAQLGVGKVQFNIDPTIYIGVVGRSSDDPMEATMKEMVYVPAILWYQAQKQTALYLKSGINGPLDGFGDSFQVPIGFGALFAVNNRLDFGGEFVFENLAGKESSADSRMAIAKVNLRL